MLFESLKASPRQTFCRHSEASNFSSSELPKARTFDLPCSFYLPQLSNLELQHRNIPDVGEFSVSSLRTGNLSVTGRYAKSKCRAKLSGARAELFEPSRKRLNVELFRRSDRYSTEPDRAETEKQRAIKRLTPLTAFSHENHG